MDNRSGDHADVYLIAVRDFVVLQDLANTVRDFDPSAVVLSATQCDDMVEKVRTCDKLALVFVEAGSRHVAALRLDELVKERGGRIVLLGDEAEDEWESRRSVPRWPTLLRPFSSQTVLSVIAACRGT